MKLVFQDSTYICAFFWIRFLAHEKQKLIKEWIFKVDYLCTQWKYEQYELSIISGTNACSKPHTMMIKTNNARFTSVAMAATSRWSENIAAVTISHLFEYSLPRILHHIKHFFVVDVKKVIAHANRCEYSIFEIYWVTCISWRIHKFQIIINLRRYNSRLFKCCNHEEIVCCQPKYRLDNKLQILHVLDVQIMKIICIKPKSDNWNNIYQEERSKNIKRLRTYKESTTKHQRRIPNLPVIIKYIWKTAKFQFALYY